MIQIHEYLSVYDKWIYNIRGYYEYLSVYDKWIYNICGYYDREELSFKIVMDLVYCPDRSSSKRGGNGVKRGVRGIVILAHYEFNFIGKTRKSGVRSK